MAGLGFRPLGYQFGGILDQSDLGAVSTGDLGAISTAPVSQNAPDTLEYQFLRAVEEGPDIGLAFARTYRDELLSMIQNDEHDRAASAQIFMQMLSSGALEGGPIGAGMDMPYADEDMSSLGRITGPMAPMPADTREEIGAVGMPPPWNMGFVADSTVSRGPLEYADPGPWYATGRRLEDVGLPGTRSAVPGRLPAEETVTETEFMTGYPGLKTGGYVKQKYAYGGSVPHGTVAGELGRRGDMSVREEGETMAELSKRHREQDWYSKDKMGGGLGSLGPLRRDRRRA